MDFGLPELCLFYFWEDGFAVPGRGLASRVGN